MNEWTEAKQALREHQSNAAGPQSDSLPGEVIKIKELEDAVVPKKRNFSGTVAPISGALVIDCSKRASVFFRCVLFSTSASASL